MSIQPLLFPFQETILVYIIYICMCLPSLCVCLSFFISTIFTFRSNVEWQCHQNSYHTQLKRLSRCVTTLNAMFVEAIQKSQKWYDSRYNKYDMNVHIWMYLCIKYVLLLLLTHQQRIECSHFSKLSVWLSNYKLTFLCCYIECASFIHTCKMYHQI